MTLNRRSLLLTAVALPAGCAIQPLAPFSATKIDGPAGPASLRAPSVGQSWTYRQLNFFNSGVLGSVQETIASVGPAIEVTRKADNAGALPAERHAAWGQLLRDPVWDYPINFEAPVPLWPESLAAGAKASVQTHYLMDGGSIRFWIQDSSVVRGWERITVAAGTFDTLRVERFMRLEHQDHNRSETLRQDILWLSPEVGRWVARDTSGGYFLAGDRRFLEAPSQEDHFHWELTAWR
jgi:hypothetical protein